MKKVPCLCLLLLLAAGSSYGQNNEVTFSAGGVVTSSQTMTLTFQTPVPCTIPNCTVVTSTFKASTAFTPPLPLKPLMRAGSPVPDHSRSIWSCLCWQCRGIA